MKKTDARRELRGVGKSGARGLQESTGNEKQLCPAESRPLPRAPGVPPPIFLEEAGGREAGPSASEPRGHLSHFRAASETRFFLYGLHELL